MTSSRGGATARLMLLFWTTLSALYLAAAAESREFPGRGLQQHYMKERKDPDSYYRGKKTKASYKDWDKDPDDDEVDDDEFDGDMIGSDSWDETSWSWGKGKGTYYKGSKKSSKSSSSKKYNPCVGKSGKGSSSSNSYDQVDGDDEYYDGSEDVYYKGGKKRYSTSDSYKETKSSKKRHRYLRSRGKGEGGFYPEIDEDLICSEMPSELPANATAAPTDNPTAPGDTPAPSMETDMPVIAPTDPDSTPLPTIPITPSPTIFGATPAPTNTVTPAPSLPPVVETPQPTTEADDTTLSPVLANATDFPDSTPAPTGNSTDIIPSDPDLPPDEETEAPTPVVTEVPDDDDAFDGTFPPGNETTLETLSQPTLYWISTSTYTVSYGIEDVRKPSDNEIDQLVNITSKYVSEMMESFRKGLQQRRSLINDLQSPHIEELYSFQTNVVGVRGKSGALEVSYESLVAYLSLSSTAPQTQDVDDAVAWAFNPEFRSMYTSLLEDLPANNIFQGATSTSFELERLDEVSPDDPNGQVDPTNSGNGVEQPTGEMEADASRRYIELEPINILFDFKRGGAIHTQDLAVIESITANHVQVYMDSLNNGMVELETNITTYTEEVSGLFIFEFQVSAAIPHIDTDGVDIATLEEKLDFDQRQAFVGESLEAYKDSLGFTALHTLRLMGRYEDVIASRISDFYLEYELNADWQVANSDFAFVQEVTQEFVHQHFVDQLYLKVERERSDVLHLLRTDLEIKSSFPLGDRGHSVEYGATLWLQSAESSLPPTREFDVLLSSAFKEQRKDQYIDKLLLGPPDVIFSSTLDVSHRPEGYSFEEPEAIPIELTPFGLNFTIRDRIKPTEADLTELTTLTKQYLRSYMLSIYEKTEVEIEQVESYYTSFSLQYANNVLVMFASDVLVGPSSTFIPSTSELDSVRERAFQGENAEAYVELLRRLPNTNMFFSTVGLGVPLASNENGGTGSSSAALVASVCGAAVVLLLLAAVGIYFYRKQKHAEDDNEYIDILDRHTSKYETSEKTSTHRDDSEDRSVSSSQSSSSGSSSSDSSSTSSPYLSSRTKGFKKGEPAHDDDDDDRTTFTSNRSEQSASHRQALDSFSSAVEEGESCARFWKAETVESNDRTSDGKDNGRKTVVHLQALGGMSWKRNRNQGSD